MCELQLCWKLLLLLWLLGNSDWQSLSTSQAKANQSVRERVFTAKILQMPNVIEITCLPEIEIGNCLRSDHDDNCGWGMRQAKVTQIHRQCLQIRAPSGSKWTKPSFNSQFAIHNLLLTKGLLRHSPLPPPLHAAVRFKCNMKLKLWVRCCLKLAAFCWWNFRVNASSALLFWHYSAWKLVTTTTTTAVNNKGKQQQRQQCTSRNADSPNEQRTTLRIHDAMRQRRDAKRGRALVQARLSGHGAHFMPMWIAVQ